MILSVSVSLSEFCFNCATSGFFWGGQCIKMDPALNLLKLVIQHWILFVFFKYQWVRLSRNSFVGGLWVACTDLWTFGAVLLSMMAIICQILHAPLYSQTSFTRDFYFISPTLWHYDKCCLFVGSRSLVAHLQALKRFVSSSICLSAGEMVACWGSRGEEALSFDLREFVWTRCTDLCPDRNMALNIPTLWVVVLPDLSWTWFQQFKAHFDTSANTAF